MPRVVPLVFWSFFFPVLAAFSASHARPLDQTLDISNVHQPCCATIVGNTRAVPQRGFPVSIRRLGPGHGSCSIHQREHSKISHEGLPKCRLHEHQGQTRSCRPSVGAEWMPRPAGLGARCGLLLDSPATRVARFCETILQHIFGSLQAPTQVPCGHRARHLAYL